jgi:hypothetical protein
MKMRPFLFFEDCPMPALFAYLLAVCILLGGGYGALNWLAAPEPAKVTAKAKHTGLAGCGPPAAGLQRRKSKRS